MNATYGSAGPCWSKAAVHQSLTTMLPESLWTNPVMHKSEWVEDTDNPALGSYGEGLRPANVCFWTRGLPILTNQRT